MQKPCKGYQIEYTGKSFSEAPIYSRNSLFWTKWLEDRALCGSFLTSTRSALTLRSELQAWGLGITLRPAQIAKTCKIWPQN